MTVFEILAHIRSIRIQQVHLEVTRQLVPIAATSGPLNQPLCRDSWRATSCPFLRSLLSLSLSRAPLLLYPFYVSSLLHPLFSSSYDSFGSDLVDDPFTIVLLPFSASTNAPRFYALHSFSCVSEFPISFLIKI